MRCAFAFRADVGSHQCPICVVWPCRASRLSPLLLHRLGPCRLNYGPTGGLQHSLATNLCLTSVCSSSSSTHLALNDSRSHMNFCVFWVCLVVGVLRPTYGMTSVQAGAKLPANNAQVYIAFGQCATVDPTVSEIVFDSLVIAGSLHLPSSVRKLTVKTLTLLRPFDSSTQNTPFITASATSTTNVFITSSLYLSLISTTSSTAPAALSLSRSVIVTGHVNLVLLGTFHTTRTPPWLPTGVVSVPAGGIFVSGGRSFYVGYSGSVVVGGTGGGSSRVRGWPATYTTTTTTTTGTLTTSSAYTGGSERESHMRRASALALAEELIVLGRDFVIGTTACGGGGVMSESAVTTSPTSTPTSTTTASTSVSRVRGGLLVGGSPVAVTPPTPTGTSVSTLSGRLHLERGAVLHTYVDVYVLPGAKLSVSGAASAAAGGGGGGGAIGAAIGSGVLMYHQEVVVSAGGVVELEAAADGSGAVGGGRIEGAAVDHAALLSLATGVWGCEAMTRVCGAAGQTQRGATVVATGGGMVDGRFEKRVLAAGASEEALVSGGIAGVAHDNGGGDAGMGRGASRATPHTSLFATLPLPYTHITASNSVPQSSTAAASLSCFTGCVCGLVVFGRVDGTGVVRAASTGESSATSAVVPGAVAGADATLGSDTGAGSGWGGGCCVAVLGATVSSSVTLSAPDVCGSGEVSSIVPSSTVSVSGSVASPFSFPPRALGSGVVAQPTAPLSPVAPVAATRTPTATSTAATTRSYVIRRDATLTTTPTDGVFLYVLSTSVTTPSPTTTAATTTTTTTTTASASGSSVGSAVLMPGGGVYTPIFSLVANAIGPARILLLSISPPPTATTSASSIATSPSIAPFPLSVKTLAADVVKVSVRVCEHADTSTSTSRFSSLAALLASRIPILTVHTSFSTADGVLGTEPLFVVPQLDASALSACNDDGAGSPSGTPSGASTPSSSSLFRGANTSTGEQGVHPSSLPLPHTHTSAQRDATATASLSTVWPLTRTCPTTSACSAEIQSLTSPVDILAFKTCAKLACEEGLGGHLSGSTPSDWCTAVSGCTDISSIFTSGPLSSVGDVLVKARCARFTAAAHCFAQLSNMPSCAAAAAASCQLRLSQLGCSTDPCPTCRAVVRRDTCAACGSACTSPPTSCPPEGSAWVASFECGSLSAFDDSSSSSNKALLWWLFLLLLIPLVIFICIAIVCFDRMHTRKVPLYFRRVFVPASGGVGEPIGVPMRTEVVCESVTTCSTAVGVGEVRRGSESVVEVSEWVGVGGADGEDGGEGWVDAATRPYRGANSPSADPSGRLDPHKSPYYASSPDRVHTHRHHRQHRHLERAAAAAAQSPLGGLHDPGESEVDNPYDPRSVARSVAVSPIAGEGEVGLVRGGRGGTEDTDALAAAVEDDPDRGDDVSEFNASRWGTGEGIGGGGRGLVRGADLVRGARGTAVGLGGRGNEDDDVAGGDADHISRGRGFNPSQGSSAARIAASGGAFDFADVSLSPPAMDRRNNYPQVGRGGEYDDDGDGEDGEGGGGESYGLQGEGDRVRSLTDRRSSNSRPSPPPLSLLQSIQSGSSRGAGVGGGRVVGGHVTFEEAAAVSPFAPPATAAAAAAAIQQRGGNTVSSSPTGRATTHPETEGLVRGGTPAEWAREGRGDDDVDRGDEAEGEQFGPRGRLEVVGSPYRGKGRGAAVRATSPSRGGGAAAASPTPVTRWPTDVRRPTGDVGGAGVGVGVGGVLPAAQRGQAAPMHGDLEPQMSSPVPPASTSSFAGSPRGGSGGGVAGSGVTSPRPLVPRGGGGGGVGYSQGQEVPILRGGADAGGGRVVRGTSVGRSVEHSLLWVA